MASTSKDLNDAPTEQVPVTESGPAPKTINVTAGVMNSSEDKVPAKLFDDNDFGNVQNSNGDQPIFKPGESFNTEKVPCTIPELEEPPKKVAKVVSTGKTAKMLGEVATTPEREFFGVNLLKKMNPPGTGSSAYTDADPVNLHHPDFIKKELWKKADGDADE